MFSKKNKTCLESNKGEHLFNREWSKPKKVSYICETDSFGHKYTEYKYVQFKMCKLCKLVIYTTLISRGNILDESIFDALESEE